jgi:site-specific recombinase XerD
VARSDAVSRLSDLSADYLRLRRRLGHKLDAAGRLLPRFVAYLDANGIDTVTVEAALSWAGQPDAPVGSTVPARRLMVVRGFARHLAGSDSRAEVPAVGLLRHPKQQRRAPFIYSENDIVALMAQAHRRIAHPLRAATFETLIGLLAVTGIFSGVRGRGGRLSPRVRAAQRLMGRTLSVATPVVQAGHAKLSPVSLASRP